MFATLFFATLAAAPAPGSSTGSEDATKEANKEARLERSAQRRLPRFDRHLTRPRPHGPRFLDHGVLGVGVAGGYPHLYRVQVRLGLLDHLTVGATAHWLPGQPAPGWSPLASFAFVRRSRLEVGVTYHQILHPPPRQDDDPATPGFQQRTHYVLGTATFSQAWFAAGFDAGVAHLRLPDPGDPEAEELFVERTRLAGGLHLRVGTRRFGLTLQAQAPELTAEAVFDVRFGLFERRERGAWLDY